MSHQSKIFLPQTSSLLHPNRLVVIFLKFRRPDSQIFTTLPRRLPLGIAHPLNSVLELIAASLDSAAENVERVPHIEPGSGTTATQSLPVIIDNLGINCLDLAFGKNDSVTVTHLDRESDGVVGLDQAMVHDAYRKEVGCERVSNEAYQWNVFRTVGGRSPVVLWNRH